MSIKEDAINYHCNGFNCAQSVAKALAPLVNADGTMFEAIAAGFGGGVNNAEICGACTGAIMTLGLASHNPDLGVPATALKEFTTRFKAEFKGLTCRDILGHDITDPAQRQIVKDKNLFATKCRAMIGKSAQMAQELIEAQEIQ